ncbi:GNAT family N-acetyltransferase [Paenibacillus sp. SAF-054]|uniref:GNAT family N-acetyltransferase n=1 Tax=unclassified Paenibacillus TaxID=185978 RepID=UPI003F7F2540
MNRARVRYEKFSQKDIAMAREMLSEDIEGGEEILQVLIQEPGLFRAAFAGGKLVALAQVNEPVPQSYLNIFVSPQFRRQGIGSAMVRHFETELLAGGTEKIRSSHRAGHPSSNSFARKLGYDPYFLSASMQRTGDPFPLEVLPVRRYTDEDYPASQSLYARAFHDMRVRVGSFPDSVIAEPSEKERISWSADADTRFVYEFKGEVVAYSHLSGNVLSSISVHPDFQGLGIGRKFVMYLCNEIYRRGFSKVELSCVVGNDARKLYDSLGFTEKYVTQYIRKTL